MQMTLSVLLYASIAAGAAGLGALPLLGRPRIPSRVLGRANALAAGLMLGAAYLLMSAGLQYTPLAGGIGAAAGIALVWLTHAAAGTSQLELNRVEETSELYVYQVLLVETLPAAPEGVAIGAAMATNPSFGLLMTGALALHNIPEAVLLSAVLRARGVPVRGAAGLAVATNVPQVLLAITTYAVVAELRAALPFALGGAFGALVYLVMAELLSESYREAGSTSVALTALVAMGLCGDVRRPGDWLRCTRLWSS